MTNLPITPSTTIEIEFNYASLILEPYSATDSYSSKLLKEVLSKLNDAAFPQNKKIIDRFANRTVTERRNLIIISSPFERGGLRSFGKIALIKNKAPQLLVGKDVIEEIEKPENKQFIEVTNFVINFNPNSDPVIMIEYNHSGPRLSDIEYYFRQISKDFRIAKLYPNPNNGEFTLAYDLKQTPEATINISDITGSIVYTAQITNETNLININTNDLRSGMYFIQLNSKGSLLWTNKVMISK